MKAHYTHTICLLNTARARRGDGKERAACSEEDRRPCRVNRLENARFVLRYPHHAAERRALIIEQTLRCKCMETKHSFKCSLAVVSKQLMNDKKFLSVIFQGRQQKIQSCRPLNAFPCPIRRTTLHILFLLMQPLRNFLIDFLNG